MAIPCQLHHGKPYVDISWALGYLKTSQWKSGQGLGDIARQEEEVDAGHIEQRNLCKKVDARSISISQPDEDSLSLLRDSLETASAISTTTTTTTTATATDSTTSTLKHLDEESILANEISERKATDKTLVEDINEKHCLNNKDSLAGSFKGDTFSETDTNIDKDFITEDSAGDLVFDKEEDRAPGDLNSEWHTNSFTNQVSATLQKQRHFQSLGLVNNQEPSDKSNIGGIKPMPNKTKFDKRISENCPASETTHESRIVMSLVKEFGLNVNPVYDNSTQDLALEAFLLLLFKYTDEGNLGKEQKDICRQIICEMCQVYAQYVTSVQGVGSTTQLQIPVGYNTENLRSQFSKEEGLSKIHIKPGPKGLTKNGKRRGRPPKALKEQQAHLQHPVSRKTNDKAKITFSARSRAKVTSSGSHLAEIVPKILRIKREKEGSSEETATCSVEPVDNIDGHDDKPDENQTPLTKEEDFSTEICPKELIFKCKSCGKAFGKKDTLMRHCRELCKAGGPLACDLCGKVFPRRKNLMKHRRRHFGKKQYKCQRCDEQFESWDELVVHRGTHGKRVYKCSVCDKHLASKHSLEIHERTHTNERPFTCEQCGKAYRQQSSLLSHQLSHTGIKNYICEVCGKQFSEAILLRQHSVIHREKKPYECKECGKGFNNSSNMQKHMWHHTGEKPHKCEICNLGFLKLDRLNAHMCSHTGEMPYTCATCGKQFAHIRYLKRHELTHTDVRPHKCTICDKAFRREHHLKVHTRRHNGIRPYACSHCDRRFTEKHDCYRHELLHLGIKPYSCVLCAKQFSEIRILRKHIRTSHGDQYVHSTHVVSQNLAPSAEPNNSPIAALPTELGSLTNTALPIVQHSFNTGLELGQDTCTGNITAAPTSVSQSIGLQETGSDGKTFQCQGCMLRYETLSDLKYHKQLCPKSQLLPVVPSISNGTWGPIH